MKQSNSSPILHGFTEEDFDKSYLNDTDPDFPTDDGYYAKRVKFYFYSPLSNNTPILINLSRSDSEMKKQIDESFNAELETKFIIHGWKSNSQEVGGGINEIVQAYISKGNVNVIAVDWDTLASKFYISAIRRTKYVGKLLAKLIDYLVANQKCNLKRIHIIGHSLGAHVGGHAGANVKTGKIGRITGLDPAYLIIDILNSFLKLDRADAEFVDVIHTTGGTLGYKRPIGHADFYPNGGRAKQPGCGGILEALGKVCSHGRAHEFFRESILSPSNKEFFGLKCNSWWKFIKGDCEKVVVKMGESASTVARGMFFLETNSFEPYSRGRQSISSSH